MFRCARRSFPRLLTLSSRRSFFSFLKPKSVDHFPGKFSDGHLEIPFPGKISDGHRNQVIDLASIFRKDRLEQMHNLLAQIHQETQLESAIVTVKDLHNYSSEEASKHVKRFAIDFFENW